MQDDGPGVTDRADFAQNRLAIIVPADNPAGIESLDDLTEDGVQLVLAAEGVPAGDYAREIFQNAGISEAALANVVSNEEDVKAVITKVISGEADAGIGYVTRRHARRRRPGHAHPDPRRGERHRDLPDRGRERIRRRPTSRRASSSTSLATDSRRSPSTASSPLRRGRIPAGFVVLATLGVALVALPLLGLVLRTPWSRIGEILTSETALAALRLSLIVATTAAAISFVLGFPLAWVLVRSTFPGKTLVRAIVVLPLVMPPVVAGVGLLAAFGRRSGLIGSWLYEWFGIQLTFTTAAAVLAATFVSFPLAVLALEAGLRGLDERLEDAASTLGASRWYVLRRVTVPLMGPQIAAALVLSWARALGEFGATITFAGNLQGRTQTLPLAVFEQLQTDTDAAFAVSMLLILLAFAVILALRGRFLR